MQVFLLTALVMVAFAANSVLCRAALTDPAIDATSFTTIRIASGALALWLIVTLRPRREESAEAAATAPPFSWRRALGSPLTLFGYALPFSLAYIALDAGTGALILFGAVQMTMIVGGLLRGERPVLRQWVGAVAAVAGMVVLVAPGVTAPEPVGALLMAIAGVSWGLYSLLGKGANDPVLATCRNFVRAVPLAVIASAVAWGTAVVGATATGVALAVTSGAITSGVGYALWYRALRSLTATTAAVVQLSVPVITAIAGVLFLSESVSARLIIATVCTLGGIALFVVKAQRKAPVPTPEPTD